MTTARRCSSARARRASRRCWRSAAGRARPSASTPRFPSPSSTTGSTRRSASIRTTRRQPPTSISRSSTNSRRHPRVIAWGEMGLDYHYDDEHAPRDVQQRVFRRQLAQARAAKLPIVIHCRDAWDDCLAILESDWRPSGLGGIFHCFTAHARRSAARARHGLSWSRSRATSPTRKCSICATWRASLPLESLLTETDSPFLPPQGRRGKRNEPAFVVEVAQALANVRNLAARRSCGHHGGEFSAVLQARHASFSERSRHEGAR